MVPLMERIAWEIANKVSTVINVRQIFREFPSEMKKKISEAQTVLQKWKEVATRPSFHFSTDCSSLRFIWIFDKK